MFQVELGNLFVCHRVEIAFEETVVLSLGIREEMKTNSDQVKMFLPIKVNESWR